MADSTTKKRKNSSTSSEPRSKPAYPRARKHPGLTEYEYTSLWSLLTRASSGQLKAVRSFCEVHVQAATPTHQDETGLGGSSVTSSPKSERSRSRRKAGKNILEMPALKELPFVTRFSSLNSSEKGGDEGKLLNKQISSSLAAYHRARKLQNSEAQIRASIEACLQQDGDASIFSHLFRPAGWCPTHPVDSQNSDHVQSGVPTTGESQNSGFPVDEESDSHVRSSSLETATYTDTGSPVRNQSRRNSAGPNESLSLARQNTEGDTEMPDVPRLGGTPQPNRASSGGGERRVRIRTNAPGRGTPARPGNP